MGSSIWLIWECTHCTRLYLARLDLTATVAHTENSMVAHELSLNEHVCAPATMEWKSDEVRVLIDRYQKSPCFWDIKAKDCKNNKHKVICEQRLYINLCTQMKTIATYWATNVCPLAWACVCVCMGIECVRVRVNMRCVCVVYVSCMCDVCRVVCVCVCVYVVHVCGACVRGVCVRGVCAWCV